MTLAPPAERALLVPDAAHWAAAGIDVGELGLEPVGAAPSADLIVLPAKVPRGLIEAIRRARCLLPDPAAVRVIEGAGLAGAPAADVISSEAGPDADTTRDEGDDAHDGHEEHDGHDEHGGGDGHEGHQGHEDMMAVTGEPSSDGLVMEDAEATIGPLAPALATGLLWNLTLDGDVVCESRIASVLKPRAIEDGATDPLARAAWRLATERADGSASPDSIPPGVAAVEIERALSHTMWLARFGTTVGLTALAARLHRAARPLIRLHGDLLREIRIHGDLRADRGATADLSSLAELRAALSSAAASRGLSRRTRTVGVADAEHCRDRGVSGPVARAAGISDDARASDPAYRALEFAPAARTSGDAEARAAVRIEEAIIALELAERAVTEPELPVGEGAVEGPRGPLSLERAGRRGPAAPVAHGAAAARALAASAARGHELSRATVAVASFDLSPWAVDG